MFLGAAGVFRDVEAIDPDVDFTVAVEKAIRRCDMFLCLIGPAWASVDTADGSKRLAVEDDPVRIEVETALNLKRLILPHLGPGC